MKNNILVIFSLILISICIVLTIKYLDKSNEIKELSNKIEAETLKEELNDSTRAFVSQLYKGEHLHFFSKDAIARYSLVQNEEFNEIEETLNLENDVEFYIVNTTLERKKYVSYGIYADLTKDSKGLLYSKTLLLIKIEWIKEDGKYKVNHFEISFLDSQLSEFQ